jgi:16S rRNA (guanine527-N7)-methyltransferase
MTSPPTSILESPPGQPSLADLVERVDHSVPAHALDQFARYRELLRQRNERTNLTAVRDAPGIDRRLIIESLRLAPVLASMLDAQDSGEVRLLDLGTGAGVPGVVLAIAFPGVSVTLLDATRKKTDFLDEVIRELELANTTTLNGRAEDFAHQPRWRNQFDLVTARAVSSLPTILELAAPFLRTGGQMLLPKGTDIDEELAQAERAASILGVEIVSSAVLPDAGSTIDTRLVIARKLATTPRTYPRRSGIPARQPLGTVPTGKKGGSR